jgi:hypothetical protein
LAIWLLINLLFVVLVMPPRRPRKAGSRASDGKLAPTPIDGNAHRYDAEEQPSVRHIIISVAMGAFFVLAPPLIEALEAMKRALKKPFALNESESMSEASALSPKTIAPASNPYAGPMRPQKITFGEMRASGARGVVVFCRDHACSHSVTMDAELWPDSLRLSDIEEQFVCQKCGNHGADLRPVYDGQRQAAS